MGNRYTDGDVTVQLDDGLDRFVRGLLSAAETQVVRRLEAEAQAVADQAQAKWYQQVDRETGKSGAIEVVTTFNGAKGTVTVSVGSTDDRRDKKGKPAVAYVHSPRATSLVKKQVSNEEYWKTRESMRANYKPQKGDVGAGPFIWIPNPKAANGRFLLQELIKKPLKARMRRIAPELAAAIAKGGRRV